MLLCKLVVSHVWRAEDEKGDCFLVEKFRFVAEANNTSKKAQKQNSKSTVSLSGKILFVSEIWRISKLTHIYNTGKYKVRTMYQQDLKMYKEDVQNCLSSPLFFEEKCIKEKCVQAWKCAWTASLSNVQKEAICEESCVPLIKCVLVDLQFVELE